MTRRVHPNAVDRARAEALVHEIEIRDGDVDLSELRSALSWNREWTRAELDRALSLLATAGRVLLEAQTRAVRVRLVEREEVRDGV